MLPDLQKLTDSELEKELADIFTLYHKDKEEAPIFFYTAQEFLERLAKVQRYTVFFKIDFPTNKITIKTVRDKPPSWACDKLRDLLLNSCRALLTTNLILFGFELEYNRTSILLNIGEDPARQSLCLGFKKAKKGKKK